ncbi:MAG: L-threonylcarbamoyladenylate synthase [Candidatus Bathyarchaeia archaeon]|jgi:L-threonylcarbamoyladenylate synthase
MTVLKATKNNIKLAAQTVKQGGLVVYPTETVYGLGCDPINTQAVERLLDVKGNRKSPFPLLVASLEDARRVAFVSENGERLAKRFWPGQLTMVFPKKPVLPDIVTLGWDTVGLRVPDNKVALELIRLSGGLLVGSSANRTAEKPPQRVEELSCELENLVDLVIDGGAASMGLPSTVVDLTSNEPRIVREGPVSLDAILDVLASGA